MNWKKVRQRERQDVRLKSAIIILGFFALIALVGILSQVSLKNLFPVHRGPKETVAPIPENDPALELTTHLNEKKIAIDATPVATDSALMVTLQDGGIVVFSTNKNLDQQVDSLQIILSRLTIEGKKFQKIDFRYDLPTIIY